MPSSKFMLLSAAIILGACATTQSLPGTQEPDKAPHSDIFDAGEPGEKKGMSWELLDRDGDAVRMQCDTKNGCNPYKGDMVCSARLPLLCFNETGEEQPRDSTANMKSEFAVWSHGRVAATPPVPASNFETLGDANAFCRAKFGPSWRTSEFHEGRNWGFWAYANTPLSKKTRYWLDINDQRRGTCWNRDKTTKSSAKPNKFHSYTSEKKGMTLSVTDWGPDRENVLIGCDTQDKGHACNPYRGDMRCSKKLPVMCFKPGTMKKPETIQTAVNRGWSGGSVAASRSLASGNQFKTTADVDSFCEQSLGEGWRALEYYDGKTIRGQNSWAKSVGFMPEATWRYRFWANIKTRAHATCWDNGLSGK